MPNSKPHALDDVGQRIDHYTQLLDLWRDGYDCIGKMRHLTAKDKERRLQLSLCIDALEMHLLFLSTDYKKSYFYRNEINGIKIKEIIFDENSSNGKSGDAGTKAGLGTKE